MQKVQYLLVILVLLSFANVALPASQNFSDTNVSFENDTNYVETPVFPESNTSIENETEENQTYENSTSEDDYVYLDIEDLVSDENDTEQNDAVENETTENQTTIYPEIVVALNQTINTTINNTANFTDENITLNLSIGNITANITITNESYKSLVQEMAEIGKPVKWKKIIVLDEETSNFRKYVPSGALNYQVQIVNDTPSQNRSRAFERLSLNRTAGNVTLNETVVESLRESNVSVDNYVYEIIYETPAPELIEGKQARLNDRFLKNVTVSSDYHYTNVLTYTSIPEMKGAKGKLHWILNGTKLDVTDNETVNFSLVDTNGNGLYDRAQWITPHLSNQSFEVEVSITVLNVQSFPSVGGNWTVRFETTGMADLIISAVGGTTWSNANEDNDLKFLEIKCGDDILSYTWENNSVVIGNYSCDKTGYEISKVLTNGKHHLKFQFGDEVAYAHNQAGDIYVNNSPTSVCWSGHALNFSTITDALAVANDGDVIVVCNSTVPYSENVNVDVEVVIEGNESGVPWNAADDSDFQIDIQNSTQWVNISNFKMDGPDDNYTIHIGGNADYAKIYDNEIYNTDYTAVKVFIADYANVSNNIIHDVHTAISTDRGTNHTFSSNTIYDIDGPGTDHAVYLWISTNVTIDNNYLYNIGEYGIQVVPGVGTQSKAHIHHNNLSDCINSSTLTPSGIRSGSNSTVYENIVEDFPRGIYADDNADIYDNIVSDFGAAGISAGGDGVKIHENIVENYSTYATARGIQVSGSGGNVSNNRIDNVPRAIQAGSACGVYDNNITDFRDYGIYTSSDNVKIYRNNISDSTAAQSAVGIEITGDDAQIINNTISNVHQLFDITDASSGTLMRNGNYTGRGASADQSDSNMYNVDWYIKTISYLNDTGSKKVNFNGTIYIKDNGFLEIYNSKIEFQMTGHESSKIDINPVGGTSGELYIRASELTTNNTMKFELDADGATDFLINDSTLKSYSGIQIGSSNNRPDCQDGAIIVDSNLLNYSSSIILYAENCGISNNFFETNGSSTIYVYGGDTTINNNTFELNGSSYTAITIYNKTDILDNNFSIDNYRAIYVYSNGSTISGNHLNCTTGDCSYGIDAEDAVAYGNASDLIIHNNTIESFDFGITLSFGSRNITISDQVIRNCFSIAFSLSGSNNTLRDSSITDSEIGISSLLSTNFTLMNVNITDSNDYGIWVFFDTDTGTIYNGHYENNGGNTLILKNTNWIINGSSSLTNDTLITYANITVIAGGNLTVNNSTIQFNITGDGDAHINVSAGTMHVINNSLVTSNDTNYEYEWYVYSSDFLIEDSKVMRCGYPVGGSIFNPTRNYGLFIDNSVDCQEAEIITGSNFSDFPGYGVIVNGSNCNISNNTFSTDSAGSGIFSSGDDLVVYNNTFYSVDSGSVYLLGTGLVYKNIFNIVDDSQGVAVLASGASDSVIMSNEISCTGGSCMDDALGIATQGVGYGNPLNVTVRNNTIKWVNIGLSITDADNWTIINNTIHSSDILIFLSDSNNTNLTETHTYNSSTIDFYVESDADRNVYFSEFILDNPLGNFVNFTNLSLVDIVDAGTGYSLNWTEEPDDPYPETHASFDQKFVDISPQVGSPVIDSVIWHWTDAEVNDGGYNDSNFELWKYNASGWNKQSAAVLDANANTLTFSNFNPASDYGILQINESSCAIINTSGAHVLVNNLEGAPINANPRAGTACIKIEVSDVILDCNGYSITNNGTAGVTRAILLNGSIDNVTIKNCSALVNYTYGIEVYDSDEVNISDQNIYNNSQHGILINSSDVVNITNATLNNNSYGLGSYGSDELNLTDAEIFNNSQNGILINNSNNTYLESIHFYNNDQEDFFITTASEVVLNTSTLEFDNSLGNYDNYTRLKSLDDTLDANTAYSIDWTTNAGHPPGKISFKKKFIDITPELGSPVIDKAFWTWDTSELIGGYNESRFELWKYNASGWTDLGATLDTGANTLNISNFNPASDYGIFWWNVSVCMNITQEGTYTLTSDVSGNPYAVTFGESPYGGWTCMKITAPNVVLDCDGYYIVNASGALGNKRGIFTNSSNVTIRNCPRIGDGYYFGLEARTLDNLTLNNVTIENVTRDAFHFEQVDHSHIFNSTAYWIPWSAFYFSDCHNNTIEYNAASNPDTSFKRYGFYLTDSTYNNLTNNSAYELWYGIWSVSTSSYNNIINNTFFNASSAGIYMDTLNDFNNVSENLVYDSNTALNINGDNNTVWNNEVYGSTRTMYIGGEDNLFRNNSLYDSIYSVYFLAASYNNFTNNTIDNVGGNGVDIDLNSVQNIFANNSISHITLIGNDGSGFGIDGNSNTFTNNTIEDCDRYGFKVTSDHNNFTDNSVFDVVNGIYFEYGDYNNFTNNNFSNMSGHGISIQAGRFNYFYGNRIINVTTALTDGVFMQNTPFATSLTPNNTFINNVFYNIADFAFEVRGDNCTFINNTINESRQGFYLHGYWAGAPNPQVFRYNITIINNTISLKPGYVNGTAIYVNTVEDVTISGSDIHGNNADRGIYIENGYRDITITNTHIYNFNWSILHVAPNGLENYSFSIENMTIDNPLGNIENFTVLHINDSIPNGTQYGFRVNWSNQTVEAHPTLISFDQKFVDIISTAGTVSIDQIAWTWTQQEVDDGNYSENYFQLWKYNASDNWTNTNADLNTTLNKLNLSNFNPASLYGIFEYNSTKCWVIGSPMTFTFYNNIEGAPHNANPRAGTACIKVTSSDVVIDCNGYNITNNGTAGITRAILLNGSIDNVTVMNCPSLKNYTYGIEVYDSDDGLFDNITAVNNSQYGFYFDESDYNNITNSIAHNNSGSNAAGFFIFNSNNTRLQNNIARYSTDPGGDAFGFSLENSNLSTIINNTAHNNTEGFLFDDSDYNLLENNTAYDNIGGMGFDIEDSSYNNFTNNTAYNHYAGGFGINFIVIAASVENRFVNNTVYNSDFGIFLAGTAGVADGGNNSIIGNEVYDVDSEGITLYIADDTTVDNNTVYNAGNSAFFMTGYDIFDFFGGGPQYYSCDGNNITNNTAYNANGIAVYMATNTNLESNEFANATGTFDYTGWGIGLTANDSGFYFYQANSTTMVDDLAYNHSGYGVYINESNNTDFSNTHLYDSNEYDFYVAVDSGFVLNATNLTIDNPLGNHVNFTNLTINDESEATIEYSINWTDNPGGLPVNYVVFNDKFINITNHTGAVSLDEIVWHWTQSEVASAGADEAYLELWKYNGTNWTNTNAALSVVANTLTLLNLDPASDYGILEHRATKCGIINQSGTFQFNNSIFGAPINANPRAGTACIKITVSDVILDCNGYNISNNGTAGTTRAILLNGSLDNVTIENCAALVNYTYGVEIYDSDENIVRNNTIFNNSAYNIYLVLSHNNSITNNTLYDTTESVRLQNSSYNNVTDNDAYESEYGIRALGELSTDNRIEDNRAYNNTGTGIYLWGVNDTWIFNNTVYGNDKFGIHVDDYTDGTKSYYNYVVNNTAYSNGYSSYGCWLSNNNTYTNNTAYNDSGLFAYQCMGTDIYTNGFANATGNGIQGLGISINDSGIILYQSNSSVVYGNNMYNFTGGEYSLSFYLQEAWYNHLENNTADYAHYAGFGLYESHENELIDNLAQNISFGGEGNGFHISDSNYNNLSENIGRYNGVDGFTLDSGMYNTLENNTAHNNSETGFTVDEGSYNNLTNNTAYNHYAGGFGINFGAFGGCVGNRFVNNTAYNSEFGMLLGGNIELIGGGNSTIMGNEVYDTTSDGIVLYITDYIDVINNTVYNAGNSAFFVTGYDIFDMFGGGPQYYSGNGNNFTNNTAYNANGLTVYMATNTLFDSNEFANATGTFDYTGWGIGLTANDSGFYFYQANSTTMVDDLAYNHSGYGIFMNNSNNTNFTNTHLYDSNYYDFYVATDAEIETDIANMIIDNPAGGIENFTNISIDDTVSANSAYSMNWTDNSTVTPLPADRMSFEEKYINITKQAGAVSIDVVTWHWRADETPGYVESNFELWRYNSTGWGSNPLNDTPDTVNHILRLTNMDPQSIFAILEKAATTCFIINSSGIYSIDNNLEGAPINANPRTGTTCIKITASNVVLNCSGYTITNNGTAGTTRAIELNGSLTNVTVKNCPGLSGYTYGMDIFDSDESFFHNNTAYNNTRAGFHFNNSANNTVYNNTAYLNNGTGQVDGFYFEGSDDNVIENNTAYNNTGTQFGAGIRLDTSEYNNLTTNTVYNHDYFGMGVLGSNNRFERNNATENGYGINVIFSTPMMGQSGNNWIINNTVYDNNHAGILVYLSDNTYIINNTIHDNNISYLVSGYDFFNFTGGAMTLDCQNTNLTDNIAYGDTGFVFYSVNNTKVYSNTAANGSGSLNWPALGFNMDVSGFVFHDATNTQLQYNEAYNFSGASEDSVGFMFNASEYNILLNNSAHNITDGYGFLLSGVSSNNTVENNTAYGNLDGFNVDDGSTYNNLTNNTAYDCGGGLGATDQSSNNRFERNRAYDNDEWGIRLDADCSDNWIIDNIVWNNAEMGVFINDNSNDNYVIDNTAYSNGIVSFGSNDSSNNNFTNNIAYNDTGFLIYLSNNTVLYQNTAANASGNGIQAVIPGLEDSGFIFYESNNSEVYNNTAYNFTGGDEAHGFIVAFGFYNDLDYVYSYNNTGYGLFFVESYRSNVSNSIFAYNEYGFYAMDSNYNVIEDCESYNNTESGFEIENSAYNNLTRLKSYNHYAGGFGIGYGIFDGDSEGNILRDSNASNNDIGFISVFNGIFGSPGNNWMINNTVRDTTTTGIIMYLAGNNHIINNTASNNGLASYLATGYDVYNMTGTPIYYGSDGNNFSGNTADDDSGFLFYYTTNTAVYSNTAGNGTGLLNLTVSGGGSDVVVNDSGFLLYYSNTADFYNNTAYNFTAANDACGFILNQSNSSSFELNTGYENYRYGFWLIYSDNHTFLNNTAYSNFEGFYAEDSDYNNFTLNTARFNNGTGNVGGFETDSCSYSTFDRNIFYNNTGTQLSAGLIVSAGDGNNVTGNEAHNHTNGFGIVISQLYNSRMEGNNATNNAYGLTEMLSSTLFGIPGNNDINNNTVSDSSIAGIMIYGSDNTRIENNTVTDSGQVSYLISGLNFFGFGPFAYMPCKNNNFTSNTGDGAAGFLFYVANNSRLESNEVANGTGVLDLTSILGITYNDTGYYFYDANYSTMVDDTGYNFLGHGVYINESNNTDFSNTHLYDSNEYDFYITTTTEIITNISNMIIDNPSANYTNFTNVSIDDTVAANSAYSLNWTTNTSAPPTNRFSFDQKYVNISVQSGAVSIDSIVWHWTQQEVDDGGYIESKFEVWKYNGTNWTNTNAALSVVANTLSLTNMDPSSIYGIFENNGSICIIISSSGSYELANNLQGAPINASPFSGTTCIKIIVPDVEFDCAGYNISNNGTGGDTRAILLNGSLTNVTVKNCNGLRSYTAGIQVYQTNDSFFYNNTAYNNTLFGFFMNDSYNNSVYNNTMYNNSGAGFSLSNSDSNNFTDNIARYNAGADSEGFLVEESDLNLFEENEAYNNTGRGFLFNYSDNTTIYNNTAYNNSATGFYIEESDYNNLTENSAMFNYDTVGNDVAGFETEETHYNTFERNTAYNNTGLGFAGGMMINGMFNNITNNTVYDHPAGLGLVSMVPNQGRIYYNNVSNNGYGLVVFFSPSGFGLGNNWIVNNTVYDSGLMGIVLYLADDSYVINNTAYNNGNASYVVSGYDFLGVQGGMVLPCLRNNFTNNIGYGDSTGILLYIANDTYLESNIMANSTGSMIWPDLNLSTNDTGYYLYEANYTTMVDNLAYNYSGYGVYVNNSNNTDFTNTHLYDSNEHDFYITTTTDVVTNISNLLIDNPLGNYTDFTNLSINDTVSANSAYSINWSDDSTVTPLPSNRQSFAEKYVNISTQSGAVSIDSIVWHWRADETAGYDEENFELWRYNSTGWGSNPLNDTPDTVNHILRLTNMDPQSIFAILENLPGCRVISASGTYTLNTSLEGAPVSASPLTGTTCIKIAVSDVVFNCNGFNITNNGTAGVTRAILLNGSLDNVTVQNCALLADYFYNTEIFNSSNVTFNNNTLFNSTFYGMYINESEDLTITENIAYNNSYAAIIAYNSDNITVRENEFTNHSENTNTFALSLDNTTNSNITENTFDDNQWGVAIGNSANNNEISFNNFSDNVNFSILAYDLSNLDVLNNTFYRDTQGAILFRDAGAGGVNDSNIYGNDIQNVSSGIYIGGGQNNTIEDNYLLNITVDGIFLQQTTDASIIGNEIYNATETGIYDFLGTGITVDCEGKTVDGIDAAESFGLITVFSALQAKNCTVTDWYAGGVSYGSVGVDINHSNFTDNEYGLFLQGDPGQNTTGGVYAYNEFYDNNNYAIWFNGSAFDNYFLNTTIVDHSYYIGTNGLNLSNDFDNLTFAYNYSQYGRITYETVNITNVSVDYSNMYVDPWLIGMNASNLTSAFNTTSKIQLRSVFCPSVVFRLDRYSTSRDDILQNGTRCLGPDCDNIVCAVLNPNLTTFNALYSDSYASDKSLWHSFRGDVNDVDVLLSTDVPEIVYEWEWVNRSANIYIVNSDADINWTALKPIGRTVTGALSTDDFTEIDQVLNSGEYADNVNKTYSTNGSAPIQTESISVYSDDISNVPTAGGRLYKAHDTGILWDSSQDSGGGQFDPVDNEDLVFVTQSEYGMSPYEYEAIAPDGLDTYKGASGSITLYYELR